MDGIKAEFCVTDGLHLVSYESCSEATASIIETLANWNRERPGLVCNCVDGDDAPQMTVRRRLGPPVTYILATFPMQSVRHSKDCRHSSVKAVQLGNVSQQTTPPPPSYIHDEQVDLEKLIIDPLPGAAFKTNQQGSKRTSKQGSSHSLKRHYGLGVFLSELWFQVIGKAARPKSWDEAGRKLVHASLNLPAMKGVLSDYLRVGYFPADSKRVEAFRFREQEWFKKSYEQGRAPTLIIGKVKEISPRPDNTGGGVRITLDGFARPVVVLKRLWGDTSLDKANDSWTLMAFNVELSGPKVNDRLLVRDWGLITVGEDGTPSPM